MAGRKLQQAHHLDRTVGGDRQPPLAFPGPEAAGESRAAVLELTCAQHACHARTESEPHRPERGCPPPVVHPGDPDARGSAPGIDQAQPALLIPVSSRIEERHVIVVRPSKRLDRNFMHVGNEAVRRSDVGQGFDGQRRGKLQSPVAGTVSDTRGQSFRRVPVFQVRGVEMRCRPRLQREGDGAEAPPGVVYGVDVDRAGAIRVVDDAHESLPATVGRRHD